MGTQASQESQENQGSQGSVTHPQEEVPLGEPSYSCTSWNAKAMQKRAWLSMVQAEPGDSNGSQEVQQAPVGNRRGRKRPRVAFETPSTAMKELGG